VSFCADACEVPSAVSVARATVAMIFMPNSGPGENWRVALDARAML
jgi:hypothetical protein